VNGGLRRLAWRLGRAIYCRARGEPVGHDITTDGEAYVQQRVIAATASAQRLSVIDIGANQGDWALPFLAALPPEQRTSDRIEIHLVEPVPATREKLKVRLSGAAAEGLIKIHPVAVSDVCGRAPMHVVAETGGRSSLLSGDVEASKTIEVETTTLAELFKTLGLARAHLVKTDAEGHDLAILRGARELLAAGRIDVYQFEYNHTWVFAHAFLKDVFDLVEGLPYRVARVRPSSIEVFDAWHPELDRFFHANYLVVREPALAWFDARVGRFDISNTYA